MQASLEASVRTAMSILVAVGATETEVEARVLAETQDPMLARRLIDWIPEAFGFVLISHMDGIGIPETFSAKSAHGAWKEFPLTTEPVFVCALRVAQQMYHDGPRNDFERLAVRSSMLAVVNQALNNGSSIRGGQLSGPALIGIPAEVYEAQPSSLWGRLRSRLV
jgi:hypothetical protein